jgi:hypothetical protein
MGSIMAGSNVYKKRTELTDIMHSLKELDHIIEHFIQHTIDEIEQVYVRDEAAGHYLLGPNKKQKTQTGNH